jgi:hypothetical protein
MDFQEESMLKLTGAVLSLLLLVSPCVQAQTAEKGAAKKDDAKAAPDAKTTGPYQGVTMSGGDPPEVRTPPAGVQYITWPGFHSDATGSTLFLQMTGPVAYEMKAKGKKVIVSMMNTEVFLKTNRLAVLTQHFTNTPVKQFRLKPTKGGGTNLVITLAKKVKPTISSRLVGTFTYLVITFPPTKK